MEVKEEPASPERDEKEEEEEAIVVRHRIDSPPRSQQRGAGSPSPPHRSRRGGSSPSPVKEPTTRRGRGVEEDTRRMRVEKVSSRSGARLYSQSPSPPPPEVASRQEDRE